MNEVRKVDSFRLSVANFRPIIEAAVDLRPLTVFVGPSNTGKSYLAILIYALHQFLGNSDFRYRRRFMPNEPVLSYRRYQMRGQILSKSDAKFLIEWAKQAFVSSRNGELKTGVPVPSPSPINSMVRSIFNEIRNSNVYLDQEIRRCFGIEESSRLIRHGTSDCARITLQTGNSRISPTSLSMNFDFSMKREKSEISVKIPRNTDFYFENVNKFLERMKRYDLLSEDFVQDSKEIQDWARYFAYDMAETIISKILFPFTGVAFYLPADRTGVMHSHRAVVSGVVREAAMSGIRPVSRVSQLSGVLADFLELLVELDGRTPKARWGERLAQRLEKDILDGSVQTEPSEVGYPSLTYLPKEWKQPLPLMNTSSMVSELAPIALYLRHFVNKGDVLIIEEPESHLHPAMQATLARQIAHFVNSGIRVIVTTHSEWLLDQFANLVRLSSLPERKRKGISGAEDALRPDQFGAWLFKQKRRPKGSIVEEIKVDPDSGGLISGYESVAEELYNAWSEIGNRVADGEARQEN